MKKFELFGVGAIDDELSVSCEVVYSNNRITLNCLDFELDEGEIEPISSLAHFDFVDGRLTQTIELDHINSGGCPIADTTYFEYSGEKLISKKTAHYEYGLLNDQCSKESEELITYTYDNDGRLETLTDQTTYFDGRPDFKTALEFKYIDSSTVEEYSISNGESCLNYIHKFSDIPVNADLPWFYPEMGEILLSANLPLESEYFTSCGNNQIEISSKKYELDKEENVTKITQSVTTELLKDVDLIYFTFEYENF